jgi:hypothetical protein
MSEWPVVVSVLRPVAVSMSSRDVFSSSRSSRHRSHLEPDRSGAARGDGQGGQDGLAGPPPIQLVHVTSNDLLERDMTTSAQAAAGSIRRRTV